MAAAPTEQPVFSYDPSHVQSQNDKSPPGLYKLASFPAAATSWKRRTEIKLQNKHFKTMA